MRIRTVISFAIVLWLIGTTVAGVGLYGSYSKVDGALQANRAAEKIARSVFDLNVLTGEFLLHPKSRSRIQWQAKYEILGRQLSRPNWDLQKNSGIWPSFTMGTSRPARSLISLRKRQSEVRYRRDRMSPLPRSARRSGLLHS